MQRRRFLAGTAVAVAYTGCLDRNTETQQDQPTPDPETDVDGDGFTVCQERNLLSSAEVGRMDIFVEVGWTPGVRPGSDAFERLVEVYDSAPVEATYGAERGVNLHIEYGNELPTQSEPVAGSDVQRLADEYFDNHGYGYHYAVFVDELLGDGLGWARDGLIAVQATDLPEEFSLIEIFAHELGHSLGLERDVFRGIDSHDTPFEVYPSIMNYAALHEFEEEYLDFSDGTNSENDFDDWGFIEENVYTPNRSELQSSENC